jgi:hypothetical protein
LTSLNVGEPHLKQQATKHPKQQKRGGLLLIITEQQSIIATILPMSWTPEKVSATLSGQNGGKDDRTAQLKEVFVGLQKESEDSLAAVVEKLADGARDGEFDRMVQGGYYKAETESLTSASWRPPLGESGLLEFVLSAVPVKMGPQHPLNKQALRLVGNACADCGKANIRRGIRLATELIDRF